MARYIAIIDHAEGAYGAYFPDAPGCTAMGATEEEVVANAIDALSEWAADEIAEGRDLGTPRSYAQLLRSKEFSELGRGGMIATVPLIIETGKATRANVSMDAGILAAIDEEAARRGLTRSSFLASAAREKIKAGA
jgi:predicted RNase H-like HicB family nuclease